MYETFKTELIAAITKKLEAPYKVETYKAFKNGNLFTQPFFNFNGTNIDTGICDTYFIGATIYPDKFADVDLSAKYSEIYTTLLGSDFYEVMKSKGMDFKSISFS
mgnify:CR=1 FL=1